VLADHVADASLDVNLAAQRVALMVKGGRDAQTYAGIWNPALTYTGGDVVQTGTYGVDATNWQAFADVPAGAAPGQDYRWAAVGITQVRDLSDRWRGAIAVGDAVLSRLAGRSSSYSSNLAWSQAQMTPAPASAVAFDIKVDGMVLGTLTFAAGTGVATFATPPIFLGGIAAGALVEVVAKTAVAATNTVVHVTLFGF
jgi:hypothetical protein